MQLNITSEFIPIMNESNIKRDESEMCDANTKIQHYISLEDSSGFYVTENWSILIVNSGMIELRYDKKMVRLNESEMTIIPVNVELQVIVKKGSSATLFFFYDQLFSSNKLFIDEISQKDDQMKNQNKKVTLKLHTYLKQMLAIEEAVFLDGKSSIDTDDIFINMWFMMLRKYYQEDELINFFSLMNVRNIDFKSYILLHYENKDINTLADECNMSIPTFNRYFRNNFGESALQWLNKKKADLIYRELLLTAKSFAEIAYDNNFSSSAYLTAFCKRYYKLTPDQIRKQSCQ